MKTQNLHQLIEAYARVGAINQRRFGILQRLLVRFHEAGIECLLLKGADLIPRLYGVMGVRPMADADLLVHHADLPRIDQILTELGYRQQIDGNPAYLAPDQTLALDIITEVWYLDSLEGMWQRAVRREFEGVSMKGMGPNDLVIFLTAYSVVHRGCLSPPFGQDIALLLEKEKVDWALIVAEAVRRHLKVPIYHGLSHVISHHRVHIPDEVMKQLAPACPTEKLLDFVLRAFVTEKPIPELGHLLLFITQPGIRKWRRLKNSLFPSETFLKYRYGDRGEAQPVRTRLGRQLHLMVQALRLTLRLTVTLCSKRRNA